MQNCATVTVVLLLASAGCIQHPAPKCDAPAGTPKDCTTMRDVRPLRDLAAQAKRHVGVALSTWHFDEPGYRSTASQQFNSLTPENQMKWETVEPQPAEFSFAGGDALVAFAAESRMRVRGHTLVWHSQLAPWVKALAGDALRSAVIRHVRSVVEHWRGKIAQWDVVNEALAEGTSGELRRDSPFTSLGPTFIDDAFRAAHEADPDALLFYNDYEIEEPGVPKTEAAFRLVTRLKDAGVPIHGVGFQMHVDPRRWPPASKIQENFERFAALGLFVEITEMDVPVGGIQGTVEEKLERQAVLAHDITAACMAVPQCSGVTFWGLADHHSWLNNEKWGAIRGRGPHLPLLFDESYRPKPMFVRVADAFAGR